MGKDYGFRVHVDGAYGGYFGLSSKLAPATRRAFDAIGHADSVAIDPHKHGLQPYGCGCILFADPGVGQHYQHDSPYTYFTSADLHLGEISLECSRAGAAAVALWATQKALPMTRDGAFAHGFDACIDAAADLYGRLNESELFTPIQPPQLDIVVWMVNAETPAAASERAQRVFDRAAERDLHLALIQTDPNRLPDSHADWRSTNAPVTCLRSCLMKPEHREWLDAIWTRLVDAAT